MGRFQGMGKAEIGGGGGQYFPPDGKFRITVKRMFYMTSRKKQNMVICEVRVDASDLPEVKVGSTYSYCIQESWDSFLEKCKALIAAAALGVDPSKGDVDDVEKLQSFVANCGIETVKVGEGKKAVEMATSECTDVDTLWEYAAECAVNEDEGEGAVNPLEGTVLDLETVGTKKRNGDLFTNHFWTPVAE